MAEDIMAIQGVMVTTIMAIPGIIGITITVDIAIIHIDINDPVIKAIHTDLIKITPGRIPFLYLQIFK